MTLYQVFDFIIINYYGQYDKLMKKIFLIVIFKEYKKINFNTDGNHNNFDINRKNVKDNKKNIEDSVLNTISIFDLNINIINPKKANIGPIKVDKSVKNIISTFFQRIKKKISNIYKYVRNTISAFFRKVRKKVINNILTNILVDIFGNFFNDLDFLLICADTNFITNFYTNLVIFTIIYTFIKSYTKFAIFIITNISTKTYTNFNTIFEK